MTCLQMSMSAGFTGGRVKQSIHPPSTLLQKSSNSGLLWRFLAHIFISILFRSLRFHIYQVGCETKGVISCSLVPFHAGVGNDHCSVPGTGRGNTEICAKAQRQLKRNVNGIIAHLLCTVKLHYQVSSRREAAGNCDLQSHPNYGNAHLNQSYNYEEICCRKIDSE